LGRKESERGYEVNRLNELLERKKEVEENMIKNENSNK
jgi:hypothetical protein